jgi:hypothetical protein
MPKTCALLTLVISLFFIEQLTAQTVPNDDYWETKIPNYWLIYDEFRPIDSNIALVKRGQWHGLINQRGKILVDSLDFLKKCSPSAYFMAKKDGKIALLRPDGSIFIPYQNGSDFSALPDNTFVLETDDRTYNFDSQGQLRPFPNDQIISGPVNGFYIASDSTEKQGLMDSLGRWVIKPRFIHMEHFSNDYWTGTEEDHKILINPRKGWTGKGSYYSVFAMSEDRLGFWGFKQPHAVPATYFHYDEEPGTEQMPLYNLRSEGNYYIFTSAEKKKGVWDKKGNLLLLAQYNDIKPLPKIKTYDIYGAEISPEPSLLMVEQNGLLGLFDGKSFILPIHYELIQMSGDKIIAFTSDSFFVFSGQKRQLEIAHRLNDPTLAAPFIHGKTARDSIYHLEKGWIRLPKGEYNLRVMPMYIFLCSLEDELCQILDYNGNLRLSNVEAPQPQHWRNLRCRSVSYRKNDRIGWYIPSSGFVQEAQYDEINPLAQGRFLVQKNLHWGIVAHDGRIILPIEYDDFISENRVVYLLKNQQWHIFNLDGQMMHPGRFDNVSLVPESDLFFWGKTKPGWQLYRIHQTQPLLAVYLDKYPDYNSVDLDEGNFIVQHPISKKYGCVGYAGQMLSDFEWDTLSQYYGQKGNEFYLFKQKSLTPAAIVKGRAIVCGTHFFFVNTADNRYQVYHRDGQLLSPRSFVYAEYKMPNQYFYTKYQQKLIVKADADTWELVNGSGQTECKIKCDSFYFFTKDLYGYNEGAKRYLYNQKTGKKQPFYFDNIASFWVDGYYEVTQKGRRGLMNKDLEITIPCQFIVLSPITWGLVVVQDINKYGVFTLDGKVSIPIDQYDDMPAKISEDMILARKKGQVSLYSIAAQKLTHNTYEDIQSCIVRIPLAKSLFLIREKGKYGLMYSDCREVLAPKYDKIEQNFGFLLTLHEGNRRSLFDPASQKIVGSDYEEINLSSMGILAKKGDTWSFFKENKLIFEKKCASMTLTHSYILFNESTGASKGMIDDRGQIALEPVFDNISTVKGILFVTNIIATSRNGQIQFWSERGERLSNDTFTAYSCPATNRVVVEKGPLKGVLDANGRSLLPVAYETILCPESEDHFVVSNGGKYQHVLKGGIPMSNAEWEDAGAFYQGIAPVKKDGKWGYISTDGSFVIKPQFDFADCFQGHEEYFAAVKQNGAFFLIGTNGQRAEKEFDKFYEFTYSPLDTTCLAYTQVPFEFENEIWRHVHSNFHFKVRGKSTGKLGLVHLNGHWVLPPLYDQINYVGLNTSVFLIQKGQLYGFFNTTDKVMIEPQYDNIYPMGKERFQVIKDGRWFVIDQFGKEVK